VYLHLFLQFILHFLLQNYLHLNIKNCSRDSVVCTVTMLWLDVWEMWFKSWLGQKIHLFPDISRLDARPTQPLVQWVMRTLSQGVKWQSHEADHSFLTSASVKNEWSYTSTFQYSYAYTGTSVTAVELVAYICQPVSLNFCRLDISPK